MLQQYRRRKLRGTRMPASGYIDYVVRSDMEQRQNGQPGGVLAKAVNIVVLVYLRSLNTGCKVRIRLSGEPAREHIQVATEAALAHGFLLVPISGESKSFIVERASEAVTTAEGEEVPHLLAS